MSEKTAGRTTRKPAGTSGKTGKNGRTTKPAGAAKKPEPEPLVVLPGFEQVAPAWWDAVARVYDTLLDEASDLQTVSSAFHHELVARFEYAKALHERGYLVPDYLAERAPISPPWPLPEVPVRATPATKPAAKTQAA